MLEILKLGPYQKGDPVTVNITVRNKIVPITGKVIGIRRGWFGEKGDYGEINRRYTGRLIYRIKLPDDNIIFRDESDIPGTEDTSMELIQCYRVTGEIREKFKKLDEEGQIKILAQLVQFSTNMGEI